MSNGDEFCQFARYGQTMKIQKALEKRRVDVNVLNLFGESALSTATYYNQILCVEFLLANRANPKLHLSAGHTAIHIACRLGNIPILHMFLSIKIRSIIDDEQERLRQEEKHVYECLKIRDNSNLTPVDWAAAQESVSKRQKMFAYLDRRLPGVLDSRYDRFWFDSWAKNHLDISSQPSIDSQTMTERITTTRPPLMGATISQYRNLFQTPIRTSQIQQIENNNPLPSTPKTSRKVTVSSIYHIPRHETRKIDEFNEEQFIYRAERVPISTTIDFPPPPSDVELDNYEDLSGNSIDKRPSHNLLSNIFPNTSSPSSSTEQTSQQSTNHIGSSFGFEIGFESRRAAPIDVTTHSLSSDDRSSMSDDEQIDQIDYLCRSSSTLVISPTNTQTSYV